MTQLCSSAETPSALSLQCLELVYEMATFSLFAKVLEEILVKMDCISEKTQQGHLQFLDFNNTLRNNRKNLSEVNFSKNSTKTIRLSAFDFFLRPHQL